MVGGDVRGDGCADLVRPRRPRKAAGVRRDVK